LRFTFILIERITQVLPFVGSGAVRIGSYNPNCLFFNAWILIVKRFIELTYIWDCLFQSNYWSLFKFFVCNVFFDTIFSLGGNWVPPVYATVVA